MKIFPDGNFISRLKLGHTLLIPKMKKSEKKTKKTKQNKKTQKKGGGGGVTNFVSEKKARV